MDLDTTYTLLHLPVLQQHKDTMATLSTLWNPDGREVRPHLSSAAQQEHCGGADEHAGRQGSRFLCVPQLAAGHFEHTNLNATSLKRQQGMTAPASVPGNETRSICEN